MKRTIWLDSYTAAGIMAGRITRLCVPRLPPTLVPRLPLGTGRDVLYAREPWYHNQDKTEFYYQADTPDMPQAPWDKRSKNSRWLYPPRPWKHAMDMPAKAVRIILTHAGPDITHPVRHITEEHALACGGWTYKTCPVHKNPVRSFRDLWEKRYADYVGFKAWDTCWAQSVDIVRKELT